MAKDLVHAKMRRRIEKPRILLLDCTLEYKKNESQVLIYLYNVFIGLTRTARETACTSVGGSFSAMEAGDGGCWEVGMPCLKPRMPQTHTVPGFRL